MPENALVMVMGPPAGGKTTVVQRFEDEGYVRLNRDDIGGSLGRRGEIYQILRTRFVEGQRWFVLDNTYPTKDMRATVVDLGRELGLPVHLKWLQTTAEQAQLFAARRQVQRYGKLFHKEDYKRYSKDPNMFPPGAQFAYWKVFEEPTLAEGFASIERVPVVVTWGPEYTNRAIILDYDGTLRLTVSGRVTKRGKLYPTDPNDIRILDGRREVLRRWKDEGYLLLGASNQSGLSLEPDDPDYLSPARAAACFRRTNELLGFDIDVLYAPDRGGVPQTYWRKPFPGMGVAHIEKYKLNPSLSVMVGDLQSDATFATRCGFQFQWSKDFFGDV